MTIYDPPHPGSVLREDVLPELNLTITEITKQIGVSRVALSRILNEHTGISPEMALKIEKWLGVDNGGRVEL
ncbi:MAG: HigA family addiction module antidote protein [gamma proteobacterium symbiont of Taylorina sp.]|nr:HigA family addiction module antidote protein [gamma proteobacterium symbiont of Taylorina sp.]